MTYNEFIQNIKESRNPNEWFEHSENHHIIPRCLGGSDDWSNLIYLTYREHFIAHKLLHEENPENTDLAYAFMLMCRDKDGREITSEEFEIAKNAVCGLHQSPERIENRAKKLRGQTRTLEQRERISASIKEAMNRPEVKKKLSESARLRVRTPHSKETRQRISEALSGKPKGPMSEDQKLAISRTLAGRTRSQEFKDKHRAENLSVEARQSLSNSHRGTDYPRVCYTCGKDFRGGRSAKYCCYECRPSARK